MMSLTVSIEVAVPPDLTSTERGRILERFARRLLETQNYKVTEEVRLTGTEVDLLAVEATTGERVFVECKAYRSTISAEVLYKILGNVSFRGFSAGWLISTYALGKDAKGVRDELEQRPPSERRMLQIYDPPALIKRLVAARVIADPASLIKPSDTLRYADEVYLLLTPFGEFWALLVLDPETGIRQTAILYDAKSGARVTSEKTLAAISETDTTLAGLSWLADASPNQEKDTERLRGELQSVVRVPIAEHWSDYRPARPEDFVGRDQLLKEVFDFFEKVRARQSRTRLLAIKAPSGWGKSSSVLKIGAKANNIRNKNKIFVFAVDSRAATSKRFGELALFTAVKETIKAGFIEDPGEFTFGGADNPFATDAMRAVLASLAREGRLLCLIFDQFEELLYKEELQPVFDEIEALCNAVDETQENVVIGFSWKTDGTIPPEHKAYHLWHSLADRRLEFELTPFNSNEVTTALNRFSAELGQPHAPQLRRLLRDHCQGYPWLLKKLCIHILDLVRGGMDQSDVLVRSLSIQELFKKDIERLSQIEYACIKQISLEAPAEFFKIVNTYGDDVVNRLLDKRLIIRSGPRLSIYWDIFRDYVLTERVPYIPINYIPQTHYKSYVTALQFLLQGRQITYDDLASELNIAKSTADNVVRDLVMVGHAEANRKSETITALQETDEAAAKELLDFCSSHAVYRAMLSEVGLGIVFSDEVMGNIMRRVLAASASSENLSEIYRQKMLSWFMSVGLVSREGKDYVLTKASGSKGLLDPRSVRHLKPGANLFFGEAPPSNVIAVLQAAQIRRKTRGELEQIHGRNSFSALMSLGLVDAHGGLTPPQEDQGRSAEEIVRLTAGQCATIVFVRDRLAVNPTASGEEVGSAIAERYGFEWSVGSKRRSGAALKQWSLWTIGQKPTRARRKKVAEAASAQPLALDGQE
jgi:hypothetical protein